MTVTPAMEARGLAAGYGGNPVVTDVDLHALPGEVVALMGPNGAGKTTVLHTLAGNLRPLAGEVLLDGTRCTTPLHRRARQGVMLLSEDRSIFRGLSTRDNLRLGAGTVGRALELFPELEAHLHRPAGLLSGGQQKMLSLARALAAEPRVLLADELSLGLAPLVVRRLLEGVRAAAQRGVAVILIEQHARAALAVSDRAYVLVRGRVELEGAAAELSERLAEIERRYLSGASAA